jgi:hypothetical protein
LRYFLLSNNVNAAKNLEGSHLCHLYSSFFSAIPPPCPHHTNVVTVKSIFSDVTPCSPVKIKRRLGRPYCLYLEGRMAIQERNQQEALRSWRWRQCYSETSVNFHLITRHYIPEDSAVRTSNLTW